MLKKQLVSVIFSLLLIESVVAQSTCPSIITGAVLTAGQWNACFSAKQDFLGVSPTTDTSPATGSAVLKTVDFNASNSDNQITVPVPTLAWGYLVTAIRIYNASQTLTAATFGLFTAAGGGGTTIQAAGTAITVNTATLGSNNSAQNTAPANAPTQAFAPTITTLFFRVGTPQGVTATGNIELQFTWLY